MLRRLAIATEVPSSVCSRLSRRFNAALNVTHLDHGEPTEVTAIMHDDLSSVACCANRGRPQTYIKSEVQPSWTHLNLTRDQADWTLLIFGGHEMPDGWVLHVVRTGEHVRGSRRRTVGTYEIRRDGVSTGLRGTTVEAKGPGDNAVAGNGRCVEAKAYPLATQDGEHYKTIGYMVSDDSDRTPKPGIELLDTGARREILIHPGHGFLASIGCINLTSALGDGSDDIPFEDSRDRVIAAIENLRDYLGNDFPRHNGRAIPRAKIVIE